MLKHTASGPGQGDGPAGAATFVPAAGEPPALPPVAPQAVAALNAFYRRRPMLGVQLAGRPARIICHWAPDTAPPADSQAIGLKIDSGYGELVVPRAVIDAVLGHTAPGLSLDDLEPDHAAIVLEFALADALDALEASLGCRLALTTITPASETPAAGGQPVFGLVLVTEGLGTASCELRIAPGQALRLARDFDTRAGRSTARLDVPVTACVRLAAVSLTIGELGSLLPGDVVLVDDICREEGTAVAVIGEHFVAPVELMLTGARLTGQPAVGRSSPWAWSLSGEGGAPRDTEAEAAYVDGLPVQVLFEVGRVQLTTGGLGQLGPGALLATGRSLDEGLDIVVNDKRIGRGTLIKMGGELGVRIARFVDDV